MLYFVYRKISHFVKFTRFIKRDVLELLHIDKGKVGILYIKYQPLSFIKPKK